MSTAALTLDNSTFDYVRKLVHERSAIALEQNKGYLVESRLMPLARQLGLGSLAELVQQLRTRPYGELHSNVVEAMTTNETSFFRDLNPFDVLRTEILPNLIRARAAIRTLNIWSAACSSGQEPYTIAILLREHFPELQDWKLRIYASDLSQQMVERARQATYNQLEVNRGLPAAMLARYFQKSGLQWQVKPEIRSQIHFQQLNLIERWPPLPTMDVIFLRNVLIYFTTDTKRQILANMRRQLAAEGTLFLGGAETTMGIDDAWQRVNHGKTSTYRIAAG
jgi:chemotaxis protein methyltransferase CheR